jgi:hypothetical protein
LLHYEEGVVGKWLALLKEIAPHLARAALMADPKSPVYDYFVRSANAAAASLAIDVVPARHLSCRPVVDLLDRV